MHTINGCSAKLLKLDLYPAWIQVLIFSINSYAFPTLPVDCNEGLYYDRCFHFWLCKVVYRLSTKVNSSFCASVWVIEWLDVLLNTNAQSNIKTWKEKGPGKAYCLDKLAWYESHLFSEKMIWIINRIIINCPIFKWSKPIHISNLPVGIATWESCYVTIQNCVDQQSSHSLIGYVNVQSCLLIIFQYQPISLQYS